MTTHTTPKPCPVLLDLAAASVLLGGVSRRTLYRLIRDGDLPMVKIRGRSFVRRDNLDAFVQQQTSTRRRKDGST